MTRLFALIVALTAAGCVGTIDKTDDGTECENAVSVFEECGRYESSADADRDLLACERGAEYEAWSCLIECAADYDGDCYALDDCTSRNCDRE
jgi:hypothetical protein